MHVVRNEPFELVAAVLGPFLAYAGLEADITYGPYDDSLSDPGAGLPASCDAVIVWMDIGARGHRPCPRPARRVGSRAPVSALRPLTEAPVLVANWGSQSERAVSYNTALVGRLGALTGVYICDQGALSASSWGSATPARPYVRRQRVPAERPGHPRDRPSLWAALVAGRTCGAGQGDRRGPRPHPVPRRPVRRGRGRDRAVRGPPGPAPGATGLPLPGSLPGSCVQNDAATTWTPSSPAGPTWTCGRSTSRPAP